MATLGWAVAGGIGAAAALAVAWFVLVILRFDAPVVRRSLAVARLDEAAAAGRSVDHALSVATWVGYVCTTLVLGGLVFRAVVRRAPRRLPIVAIAAAGASAAVTSVALRCMEVTGGGIEAVVDRDVLAHVVTSHFGGAMALRAAGLLLVVASLGGRPGGGLRRAGRWLAGVGRLAGAAVLAASYLVIGHAQASDPVALEVTALGVHIVAAPRGSAGWRSWRSTCGPDRPTGWAARHGCPRRPSPGSAAWPRSWSCWSSCPAPCWPRGRTCLPGRPGRPATARRSSPSWRSSPWCWRSAATTGSGWSRPWPERDDAAARARLRTTCVLETLVIGMGILLMTAAMTSGGF